MAQYTVELRTIIESGGQIFDFEYPIHDPLHKAELESKIINHYYFREICCETVGRWKHYLKTKMNEIMPKYNRIYKALAENPINIFSNQKTTLIEDQDQSSSSTLTNDLTTTAILDRDTEENVTNIMDRDTTSKDKTLKSDTAQGRTTLSDDPTGTYVSEIVENNGVGTEDSTSTTTGTASEISSNTVKDTGTTGNISNTQNDRTVTNTGYNGITEVELLKQYMDAEMNVDVMIIAELADLFMKIY
jgi:hypothetical protein